MQICKILNKYFAKETQEGIINMEKASSNITSHQRNAHQKQMLTPICKDNCLPEWPGTADIFGGVEERGHLYKGENENWNSCYKNAELS